MCLISGVRSWKCVITRYSQKDLIFVSTTSDLNSDQREHLTFIIDLMILKKVPLGVSHLHSVFITFSSSFCVCF